MHPELNEDNLLAAIEIARRQGEHPDRVEVGSLSDELRAQQIVNDHPELAQAGIRLDVAQAFDLKAGEWRLRDSGRVREA
jgi:hypothetical protein